MFEDGKTIPEIAKERGLVNETIYGHLARFAEQGILDIKRVLSKEKISAFEKEFKKKNHENLNEWKKALPQEFEFNEIRILINHYNWLKNKENLA